MGGGFGPHLYFSTEAKMSTQIDSQAYLQYSLKLSPDEIRLREQMMRFLPETIIDCHAHCNLESHVGELDEGVMHHMMSTFPGFSLEQSAQVKAVLYPGKHVQTLRFANAYRGISHRAANEYLLAHSKGGDRVALFGIPDDVSYTVWMLETRNVAALKMYYQYFNPPATLITEVFPEPILEVAQDLGIPIILHLPKIITKSLADLQQLLGNFPRLVVVLAHLGLPHLPIPGLQEAYDEVALYPNVFMDTSMIPSAEVHAMALKAFGPSRIMFGSDEPLNLIRSRVFHHPTKGERLITEYPYHWVDPDDHAQFQHLAHGLTMTHWQVLSAIQQTTVRLPVRTWKRVIEAVFYTNARSVFKFS
jgi:hypothetical protein